MALLALLEQLRQVLSSRSCAAAERCWTWGRCAPLRRAHNAHSPEASLALRTAENTNSGGAVEQ